MFDIMMKFDNYKYKLVLIHTNSLKMSIDERIININKDDIDNLYRILRYFDNNTFSNMLDPISYYITIGDSVTYEGNSSSNKYFKLLNDWIGDINGR